MKPRVVSISILVLIIFALAAIYYCDKKVTQASDSRLFNNVEDIPHKHVGLLLGTGKYLKSGVENYYYKFRIDATIQLMKAGKIDQLIISGDNSRKDYNEPEMMRADLIAAGIDSTRIHLDYAGFRTFDSMIRLREIFSQRSVTVISQKFHNERALYIAQREDIDAIAFNAQDVSYNGGMRMKIREKLARVKVLLDYVFQTKPKFLGPKVEIPLN